MISCDEAVQQLWGYVEQELDAPDRERLESHLDLCRRCCGEMEFAEELQAFMGRQSPVELPPAVAARFDRVLDELQAEGAT